MKDKMELIDEIIAMEWWQFQAVENEGGRASCQDDLETFTIMRKSQFLAWDTDVIESYHRDISAAREACRNLITEKYGLVEVDDYISKNHLWPIYRMLDKFDVPYINVRVGDDIKHYTDLDKLKKLVESVNVEQQPLVVKGTDWPYWFNFEGKLIPSKTSNWFKYLQTEFDYVAPSSLVPYTGDDMCDKHPDKE